MALVCFSWAAIYGTTIPILWTLILQWYNMYLWAYVIEWSRKCFVMIYILTECLTQYTTHEIFTSEELRPKFFVTEKNCQRNFLHTSFIEEEIFGQMIPAHEWRFFKFMVWNKSCAVYRIFHRIICAQSKENSTIFELSKIIFYFSYDILVCHCY